jgi:hypothetical protein
MSSPFEPAFEKDANPFEGIVRRYDATAKADDVRVIVLPGEPGRLVAVDEGGPDSRELVGCNTDADARSAHEDPHFSRQRVKGGGHLSGIVRVINRFLRVGSDIGDLKTRFGKLGMEKILKGQACVVGTHDETGFVHDVYLRGFSGSFGQKITIHYVRSLAGCQIPDLI